MIKQLAIGGVLGLIFMSGGFWFGLRLIHVPAPAKTTASPAAKMAAAVQAARDAISVDSLRKTSEHMMEVDQAVQARAQAVAAREKKAQEKEDELAAERAALDRAHAKFQALYGQFQQRLQLVQANEADQLQREAALYTAMDPAQAADLLRSLDDGAVVRLFSIMENKPLVKLVAAWKTKYPADATRVLTALTGMGRVMPQEKIALADAAPTDAANAPAAAIPPAAAADAVPEPGTPATSATAPDSAPGDTTAPADAAAPAASAPAAGPSPAAAAPSADATGSTGSSENNGAADAGNAPGAGSTTPSAQQPAYSTPDAAVPAAAPNAPAPPVPAEPPTATPPLSPPADATTDHGTTSTSTANPPDNTAFGVPGATAAQSAAAQRRAGRLSADISTDRYY